MFWVSLLIVHGLLAVALMGAVTHQAVAVFRSRGGKAGFVESYATVRDKMFTNAIIWLYLATFVVGSWIYTHYRYTVRTILEDLGQESTVGIFEYKEHILAVGLALLPVYWLLWHRIPTAEAKGARKGVTVFIAIAVWVGFLGGHIVNNVRGLM
ncbi:hypothetical protein [Sphingomonas montanisoli]|uniref:DUF2269 family protein n=1 Tax=Sphingomonas montanisoli TaxID=2606412 RepID=A0A5D9C6A9_9SPHN|nr:hypothetical protein [Sphingomonas montanisoli]TZG27219.1 hypothetical protein FYJ91_06235 [Sphingomonas montanisoli]